MHNCNNKIITKLLVIIVLIIAVVLVYHLFSPEENSFYPKCIFYSITGYKCPGCGTQRSLHYLLNGDIASAFKSNALIMTAIPFMIYGTAVSIFKNSNEKCKKLYRVSFSIPVIATIVVITVLFTVFRNIYGF